MVVHSLRLTARGLTRRQIRAKHPDTKAAIYFEKATFKGECCWQVRNKHRGGRKFRMPSVGEHNPGWNILAVELCPDD